MAHFDEFIVALRQEWRLARYQDNNLTFQEFLLVHILFDIEVATPMSKSMSSGQFAGQFEED